MPAQGGDPLASVYSGHQFGWAGQLGDGRRCCWAKCNAVRTAGNPAWAAGLRPIRAWATGAVLRPSIREFPCSEAFMHALGIPTTRALYLRGSPEPVQREGSGRRRRWSPRSAQFHPLSGI